MIVRKPRRDFRLPTSDFRFLTSDISAGCELGHKRMELHFNSMKNTISIEVRFKLPSDVNGQIKTNHEKSSGKANFVHRYLKRSVNQQWMHKLS